MALFVGGVLILAALLTALGLLMVYAWGSEPGQIPDEDDDLLPAISVTPFAPFEVISSTYTPQYDGDMEIVSPKRIQLAKQRIASRPSSANDSITIEIN